MNERRMKASQRKLVQQRDEAQAEIERLKAEIYRLSQLVEVLVASRVVAVQADAAKARQERDSVLADLEAAVSRRLGEKEQELIAFRAELATTSAELKNTTLAWEAAVAKVGETTIALHEAQAHISTLEKELAGHKVVEAKELRKRIQAKTVLLNSAERAIHSYQRVLKRLCQNGHRDAVMVALDGESTAARLGEVEMEPLMRGVCGNCNNPAVQLLRVNPMGPSGPPVCRDCHKELASAAQEVDADRSAG